MRFANFCLVLLLGLSASRHFSSAQSPAGVCDLAMNVNLPFCNSALSIDARLDDLMTRIPPNEMHLLLGHNTSAIPAIGWGEYNWKNPSLHGIAPGAGVFFRDPTPHATSFPQILNFASSFNKDLFFRVGNATANEKRAFFNAGNAGLTYFTPNVDVYSDPRWGRGHETPGEDPHLNGQYAIAYSQGLQGDQQFLKVCTGCKHYAGFPIETDRFRFNAIVDARDLADTYLPAFKDCVQGGKAAGFMCSYNRVNGIPACAHKQLMTDVLREEWGFDGYLITDNGASQFIWIPGYHDYAANQTDAVRAMLEAGIDLELHENTDWLQLFPIYTPQAIQEGLITQAQVAAALRRAFKVQFRLGYFEKLNDRPYTDVVYQNYVDTPATKALALEAAMKSIVLLKNANNALPLSAASFSPTAKLALIGPHFNTSRWFLANYQGIPSHIDTPLESIQGPYVPAANLDYALGCDVIGLDSADIDGAAQLAGAASTEQVVLFVGLSMEVEEETFDRQSLSWPGLQRDLIDRVLAAASKPVVLVLVTGGPVDLTDLKTNPKVGAILYAGYIGQAGGRAIAATLFGAYNPSGRLTHTFYSEDFVGRVPITDVSMRPNAATGHPGRTYRFYTGTPVYEFGYGISYTTFDYLLEIPSSAKQEQERIEEGFPMVDLRHHLKGGDTKVDCTLTLQLTVRNNGENNRDADHSVLQFLYPPNAGEQGRPIKYLIHFDHVYLLPGQQEVLEVCLNPEQFMLADENGDFGVVTGLWKLTIGDQVQFLNVQG